MLCLTALGLPGSAQGQSPESWNADAVLDLVQRARDARRTQAVDSAFQSYEAMADGYVYFYLDRPGSEERTLVKTDQIAVEVFWEAPTRTGQRIVGLRDEKSLPTNINYHLDHLTVVQDDFGDLIRLGDGDEVGAVLHPMAAASSDFYDFALGDSISIRYGGAEEVRVYRILVRPRFPEGPGFVGSVFVDRASASIVRMNFTFTPASYIDPYLDYIRISLDNSLWMGRHWLPYRQEVEIRRELPVLDFMAGSIIRGRWTVGDYEFNRGFPESYRGSRSVIAVPESERRAYSFRRGLFDDLDEAGLAPGPSIAEVRAQARQLIQDRYLSGLSPLRLHAGSSSDLLRYDRSEGLFVGAGLALQPTGDLRIRITGGYAIGREAGSVSVVATGGSSTNVPEFGVHWDRLEDIGPAGAASGLVASSAASAGVADYRDPWFSRGVQLRIADPDERAAVSFRWEDHRSARDVVSDDPDERRPLRAIDDGIMGAIDGRLSFALPKGGTGRLAATLGRLEDRTFTTTSATATWSGTHRSSGWAWLAETNAGWASGEAPAQSLYLLGGRGTFPGTPYRSMEADRYVLVRGELTRPLLAPWLSVRLFGSVGTASLTPDRALPSGWTGRDSDGPAGSLGAGLSLGWDAIRIDIARGAPRGRWELIFSVASRLRPWL